MQLHPYQEDLRSTTEDLLESYRRVLLQLATGGGKTAIANRIVLDAIARQKRVLILSHRREIIDQFNNALWDLQPGSVARIVPGVTPCPLAPIQVASIPTLARRSSLPPANLLVVDEAHHTPCRTWSALLSQYPQAKILGATATPVNLGGHFDAIACGPPPSQLIASGYLAPLRKLVAARIDMSGAVLGPDGDYATRSASSRIAPILGQIVPAWRTHAEGLLTLVFVPSVATGESVLGEYRAAGISAELLTDKTPADRRREMLADFAGKKFLVLISVGILTEGTDIRQVEAIQCLRPTTSIVLWFQMLGRGMRSLPGKTECVLLDHTDNALIHGLPEDDHIWTLDGPTRRPKRSSAQPSEPRSPRNPKVSPGFAEIPEADFSDLDNTRDRVKISINHWIRVQRLRKRKPTWVVLQFQRVFPKATLEDCEYLRDCLGYEPGWEQTIFAGLQSQGNAVSRAAARIVLIAKSITEKQAG